MEPTIAATRQRPAVIAAIPETEAVEERQTSVALLFHWPWTVYERCPREATEVRRNLAPDCAFVALLECADEWSGLGSDLW